MFRKTSVLLSLLGLLILLVGSPSFSQETPSISNGELSSSPPSLPSFEGFIRFQDDSQLYLDVRRVGYRSIEVQSPGASQWIQIEFDQLAERERSFILQETLIDEEMSPPQISGIRVTLESGEVIEGFTEGPNPARTSQTRNTGAESGSGEDESTSTANGSSVESFVLLTANEGRRELSMSLVKEMEEISVNPIKMVGAKELYEIERRKRSLDTAWAHWKLGKLCMKTELYQQAVKHFKQAGELDNRFQKPSTLRIDILRNWRGANEASGGANKNQSGERSDGGGGSTGNGFGQ